MMNLYAFVFYKYICWKIKKNIFLAENRTLNTRCVLSAGVKRQSKYKM